MCAYTRRMGNTWRRLTSGVRRLVSLLLLFAVLRIVVGVAVIALFERDAVAWGIEATLIALAVFAACLLAALAVRRWSPRQFS